MKIQLIKNRDWFNNEIYIANSEVNWAMRKMGRWHFSFEN